MLCRLVISLVVLPLLLSNAFFAPAASLCRGAPRSSFLGVTTQTSRLVPPSEQHCCSYGYPSKSSTTKATMLLDPAFAARKTLLWAGAAVASSVVGNKALQRYVWKYPQRDPSRSEPLPVGSYPICPLRMFQDNPREYSPDFGPGYFFYRRSKQLKHSRIWKYMTKDKATVIVSGAQLSKEMTNMEFTSIQSNVVPFSSSVVGTHSLRMADDRKEHALLRKLAGAGMTPANVANMIPSIQKAAEIILSNNADSMSSPDFVPAAEWKMHEVCTDFTLDLAMNSIIGLELKGEELPVFRQALTDWLGGIFSADMTKALEARALMVGKIEAHIENLKKSGSKASGKSALAAMVFATDDENLNTRLTNDQIIDNTLLLILAGSDTSAGTLTLTTLLLGLHPSVYAKLVQEQREAVDLYGTLLSKDLLDNRMNYLDAVLKEAMRIRPITGGSMRGTKETIVLGGKQVPAGSFITYDRYLTHLLDPVTFQKDESHMDVNKGFQPERWLDESTKPTDFIPFGVGPRYCLGAELAMAEMKVFVAVLARQLPEVKLVEPKFGQPILWKERCLVPVPKDGVILDSSMATKVEHEGDDEINWSDLQ